MRKQVFRRIWSGVLIIVLLFGLSSGMNVRAEEKVGKCDVTLLMNHYITYVKIDDQLVGADYSGNATTGTDSQGIYWFWQNKEIQLKLQNVPYPCHLEIGLVCRASDGSVKTDKMSGYTTRKSNAVVKNITIKANSISCDLVSPAYNVKTNTITGFPISTLIKPTWIEENTDCHLVVGNAKPGFEEYAHSKENIGKVLITDKSGIKQMKVPSTATEEEREFNAYAAPMKVFDNYYDYQFDHWEATGLELTEAQKKSNPMQFTMPSDRDINLTAVFKDNGVPVTITQTNATIGELSVYGYKNQAYKEKVKLKKGITAFVETSGNRLSAYDVELKLYKDGEDISDTITSMGIVGQGKFVVDGGAMEIKAILTPKGTATIKTESSNETMGTATAKTVNGTASTELRAVTPGDTIVLEASPTFHYKLKEWQVTWGDEENPKTVTTTSDESDVNKATFTVPDLEKDETITAKAFFEFDSGFQSEEKTIRSLKILDKNLQVIGNVEKTGSNYTVILPAESDDAILEQIQNGECTLQVDASDYSMIRLGAEGDAKSAAEWKTGVKTVMLINTEMPLSITSEKGETDTYILKIVRAKSNKKDILEVNLLNSTDKTKLLTGTVDETGKIWTIQIPKDQYTYEEASSLVTGGSYLQILASAKTTIAQENGYSGSVENWKDSTLCVMEELNEPVIFTITAEDGSNETFTVTAAYEVDKPVITEASAERTADTTAKIKFKSDLSGTYYYLYKESEEAAPEVKDILARALKAKITANTEKTINLQSLQKEKEYKLYLLVKSNEGGVSDLTTLNIEKLGDYTIKKNAQSGGTVTVDKSRANAGETITVTVKPNTGKRVDFLSYSTEVAGSAPVEITNKVDATTYTFEMPAANISIGCTWADVKDAAIIGFVVNGVNGVVNESAGTISIVLPYGTDLTSLKPVITLSGATSVSPASGETVNLSGSVTYTVTGEDGTTKTYKVTAVTSEQPKSDKLWESMLEQTGGSTDHTGKNTWWKKAKDMKKHNDYPKYW